MAASEHQLPLRGLLDADLLSVAREGRARSPKPARNLLAATVALAPGLEARGGSQDLKWLKVLIRHN